MSTGRSVATEPPPPEHRGDECCLLEAGDLAVLLGVTKKWVYAETRAGRIPHIRLGPRYVRYCASSVAAWLAAEERGAGSRPGGFRDG